jgi:hypothetical protein
MFFLYLFYLEYHEQRQKCRKRCDKKEIAEITRWNDRSSWAGFFGCIWHLKSPNQLGRFWSQGKGLVVFVIGYFNGDDKKLSNIWDRHSKAGETEIGFLDWKVKLIGIRILILLR